MKKFTLGKNLSRVGKILLAMVLTVALLLCSVIPSVAEDTAAESIVGYDTLNTHVYSPMDLIDGSTADTSAPQMKDNIYDSSVWKFAAKSDGEVFFKDSDDIAAPTVEPVYGGVKVSWEAFDEGVYTVLVYGEDGAYTNKLSTIGTSVTVSDLSLNDTYSIQVVSETKATELAVYKNDRIATEVFRELPVLETGDYDMEATHRAPVMNNGEGNVNYFIQLDEAGKSALNANGAIIVEVKSDIDTTNQGYYELTDNPNQDKIYYNDCWVAMNTFIYPTADTWKTVTTTGGDFYSNTGENKFYFVGGTKTNSGNMTTIGVTGGNYKGAHNFTDGYILLPLDEFNTEGLSVNLIENTKSTGKLRMGNVVYTYYSRYIKASGVEDTAGYSQRSLLDRSISFNVYIVSDYAAYVANHIDSEVNTTTAYSENVIMTNGAAVNGDSVADYIPFTANTLDSSYAFFCTTQNYTNATLTYKQRTIEYTAADGEIMTLGFTAPQNGTYEIAAPLGVTAAEGATVKYAVVKTDVSGNRTIIQNEQTYTNQNRFCDVLVELKMGETVWLESTATAGTVIDIGIPQAIRLKDEAITVDTETGATTYTFRSIDYFEKASTNGVSYSTNSVTANTKAAWDIGYFSDTVTKTAATTDDSGNEIAATYTWNNLVLPKAVDEVADKTLLNAMKPYELIRYGTYYNAIDATVNATTGAITTKGNGAAGVFYPYNTSRGDISTKLSEDPNIIANTYENASNVSIGSYLRFTAPVSGNAVFKYDRDGGAIAVDGDTYLVYMLNNVVKAVTTNRAETKKTFNIDVVVGDQVTLLYYACADSAYYFDIGCPQVTITGNYASVSYDANGGEYTANNGQLLNAGTEIVLPTAVKKNAIFKGWSMGENTYQANETVTVNADMNLVALYDYYGDIDGDDEVAVSDLVKYKKVLLGVEKIEEIDSVIADINADESVNLLDFIRMKKWLAGIAVSLGKA